MYRVLTLLSGSVSMIALWKIFEKSGVERWKAVIPVYNQYICCKLAKCTKLFYGMLVAIILAVVSFAVSLTGVMYAVFSELSYTTCEVKPYAHILSLLLVASGIFVIVLIIIAAIINAKFVNCYTDNDLLVVLAIIGTALPLVIAVVLCIIGFNDKYQYIETIHQVEEAQTDM